MNHSIRGGICCIRISQRCLRYLNRSSKVQKSRRFDRISRSIIVCNLSIFRLEFLVIPDRVTQLKSIEYTWYRHSTALLQNVMHFYCAHSIIRMDDVLQFPCQDYSACIDTNRISIMYLQYISDQISAGNSQFVQMAYNKHIHIILGGLVATRLNA